jgi:hypothetical protein
MGRDARSSTIGSMLIHPSFHLEIARQRRQDLLARAERYRLARALRLASSPLQSVPRGAGTVQPRESRDSRNC